MQLTIQSISLAFFDPKCALTSKLVSQFTVINLTANIFESGPMPTPSIIDIYTKPSLVPPKGIPISAKPDFNLIYNLEAVATRLKIFMGLALVHFQKCWLLILGMFFQNLFHPIPVGKLDNQYCFAYSPPRWFKLAKQ